MPMELQSTLPIKGRGTSDNPVNRFVPIHYEMDEELPEEDRPSPKTRFFVDQSRSILSRNNSPDIPFDYSLNPYRGCEHGCIYCYARPTHEYYGLSSGLDFETQIMVKLDAAKLLRKELMKPSWKGESINLSGVTDCYQPIERKLQLTRQCLKVMVEFRQPTMAITKSRLIIRDIDLLSELAKVDAVDVALSVTSLDDSLASQLEPRATRPGGRLAAIRELAAAGIPVGIMIAPVIPGLNDHEMPDILAAAYEAGARYAGFIPLRLPYAIKELFAGWLEQHFPNSKEKVLNRLRDLRGGQLNDPNFGSRMRGQGIWADVLRQQFRVHKKRLGYPTSLPPLSKEAFRRPGMRQGVLFE
ncbi:MAG TPA: PA0069 family radical SAM protein [Gemmatales bacterium]|nr:PA0069 family radical SAM protein [Gemmatales bacterium]